MGLLQRLFTKKSGYVPHWTRHSIPTLIWKPIRKTISVAIAPYIPFNSWRIALYRLVGFRIGKHVFIGMRCYLDDVAPQRTTIGNYVTISYGVYFAAHDMSIGSTPHMEIADGAYLGMRCNIVAARDNLRIGHNAIVGACAMVRQSVPDHAIVVGIPARIIRYQDGINSKAFAAHLGDVGVAKIMSTHPDNAHASAPESNP